MNRKSFLKLLTLTPLIGKTMNINEFENAIGSKITSDKMPLLFVGHGNPKWIGTQGPVRKLEQLVCSFE